MALDEAAPRSGNSRARHCAHRLDPCYHRNVRVAAFTAVYGSMAIAVATLLAGTSACGSSRPAASHAQPASDARTSEPPLTEDESRAVIERSARALESLASAIEAAGKDCDALARSLDAWITASEAELVEMGRAAMRIPESRRSALMSSRLTASGQAYDTAGGALAAVLGALEACQDHQGVAAAAARLDALGP